MDGASRSTPLPYRVSLVIPAFNEEQSIGQAVIEAEEALAVVAEDYEILVVDDGSSDETANEVARLGVDRPRLRLLRHDGNRGYGAALRTGFEAARFQTVAFTDADCQFHLTDLARLLPLTDKCPLAVGYREDRQDPWPRRFLSRGYNWLARTLLGTRVRDVDCALKVFRRQSLARLLPESTGFLVNTEMLTRAGQEKMPIAEAGVRHRRRCHGRSKVALTEVPRTLAALLPFWWSRVLFRGGEARSARPAPLVDGGSPGLWPALAVLMVLAALLFCTRLRAPLLEPQESRYAEIARQMLAEGNFVVPILHGQPYLDKPPLLYWLLMGSYRIFGVADWAARLVPGLAGVLTVLIAYLWGRRVVGHRAALWGAVVLCLSARFVYLGRMVTMDGLLCLCVTASLATAHIALLGDRLRRRWWLTSALFCALGVLAKGPVALILVAAPVLLYRFLDRRCPRVSLGALLAYAGIVAALSGPWFVAVATAEAGFASSYFWTHHVLRFVAAFDHAEPAWYFVPALLLGLLPWTLLLPGFVRFLGRRSVRWAARRPPALGFFLLAFAAGFLFFSASACKRPAYILPALPPLALALGCYLDQVTTGLSLLKLQGLIWGRSRRLAFPAAVLALGVGIGGVGVAVVVRLLPFSTGMLLTGGGVAAIAGLALARKVVTWPVCAAVTFGLLFAGIQVLLPEYNKRFGLRTQLRAVLAGHPASPANDRLTVICYPHRWDGVSFYLPEADVRVFSPEEQSSLIASLHGRPRTVLAAKSGKTLDDLLRVLPPEIEFVSNSTGAAVTVGWLQHRSSIRGERLAER